VPAALDAILGGKLYPARKARSLGIVDRLTQPEYLVRVASDVALERERLARRERGWKALLVDKNPLALALVRKTATKQVLAKTHGHYPAPLEALELVLAAHGRSLQSGFEAEAQALARLAASPVAKSLVGLFRLSEEAKKLGELPRAGGGEPARARAVERAGVVGAGVMGAEIASLCATQGIDVRLADLSRPQLDAGQLAHRAFVAKELARKRLTRAEADRALDRLEVGEDAGTGFARCDLVLEAVAEKLAVKRAVLGAVAKGLAPGALLATNTSSLSVAEIAAELPHPERVVGVHFFNPARRMPLVEIVRGPKTSDETVARAARFALDLKKTPVVVADVAGFLVNRLLGPYLDEAVRLYEGGADLAAVDRALERFGMPMGPFRLLDEVGLDIAAHAAESLFAAYGERMTPSAAMAPLLDRGDLGKKSGAGFWKWEGTGSRAKAAGTNPALPSRGPGAATELSEAEIADRLVLCMLNEAARCIEERVVAGPRELDLATVFGMGFAPFRGGLLRYGDARGAADVVATLTRLGQTVGVAERPGGPARFAPAPLLVAHASSGGRFHDAPSP
jgi:3-hydroxyacyl-CoA dehydrogenase/enoyl-CoA hydratase/3-hydroxybutyryl-CoA epimerase